MDHDLRPARVVQPHRILKQELEARGWTEADFAHSLGCSRQVADGILSGATPITLGMSRMLAVAFGTSAEFWYNMAQQATEAEEQGRLT